MANEYNDILLNDNGDLLIVDGDFVLGDGREQSVELMLLSANGSWVDNPLGGIAIKKFVNAPLDLATSDKLKKRIQEQLKLDGYDTAKISLTTTDGKLQDIIINGD